ncbi:MAG: amidohydrolase [Rhodothermales bacterium]
MKPTPLILQTPAGFEDFLVSCRRQIHQNPEIGFQEFETSRFIKETLAGYGLTAQGPIAKTGLFLDLQGEAPSASPTPFIGYRADIDALPIQDVKNTPYVSKNAGLAHLCGHDVHTTIAIGIARLLNENKRAFSGKIRVFFQPNEEGNPSGAPVMIRDGVLDGLEAAYAVHVDPTMPTGKYGIRKGAFTAAAVRFKVVVSSPSTGHSARPHQSIDTVWVATQIANQLYQLAGRFTDPRDATILTICRFFAGEAYNVVPAEVEFGGTLRCTSLETRQKMQVLIQKTAQAMALQSNASVTVDFDDGIPPVINDGRLVDHLSENIASLYGKGAIEHIAISSMGAEDFANYQQVIPGAMIRVGTSNGPATSYPLHDAHFDVDESAMLPAIKLMTHVLMSHVNKQVLAE